MGPGQAEVELRMSRARLPVLSLLRGGAARDQRLDAVCSRARPRAGSRGQEAQVSGADHLGSDQAGKGERGSGCGTEQGPEAFRMETKALAGGPGGRPGCPAGLTWRLCSAASNSRCRFAQTSR